MTEQLLCQSGLPNTRLATDEHKRPPSALDLGEQPLQFGLLGIAPAERRAFPAVRWSLERQRDTGQTGQRRQDVGKRCRPCVDVFDEERHQQVAHA